jgi:hypothetical protein
MGVITMINALFRVAGGLVEISARFIWWFIKSSAASKFIALIILLLIIGGVNR